MKLYNSLSRKIEEFKPFKPLKVGMYTCGPTVYDYLTIGNWRTYALGDLLLRTLKYFGFKVNYIMNITDVGHLTGDNLGDADTGEDRMEKGARREGKTAWDIAQFYTQDFLKGFRKLNLIEPKKFTKATDHIKEQIDLVKKIEKKGLTYKTSNGIYFNVKKWEKAGNDYGQLSSLDKIKEGARVKKNPEKKDARDFALWKFSPKAKKRHMEWPSPWGKGFPGWHLECSAMSMKYLGEQFDLHLGGEDLRSTHHPNEIAQSQAATAKKPFVKYWVHGAFLRVDGQRMGKSLGNAYTIQDIEKKGFEPLALRYFYLTGHYRKTLNFTWKGLEAAQETLNKLRNYIGSWHQKREHQYPLSIQAQAKDKEFGREVANDLNMPQALATLWLLMKDEQIKDWEKWELVKKWDQVLGFQLTKAPKALKISKVVKELVKKREVLRKQKKWQEADKVRKEIEKKGFMLEDAPEKTKLKKK